MARGRDEHKILARKLAVQLSSAIEESGKRIILVTSPGAQEGKTFFIRLVAPELDVVAPNRFRVIESDELDTLNPWHLPDDRIILVDGPPMLEGEGFVRIRKGWVSAFDGALLVVLGRETRRSDLEETASWLEAAKIPPIGIIWNEFVCPPLKTRLRNLIETLREPRRWVPKRIRRHLTSGDTAA